jgi:hypothetical protein
MYASDKMEIPFATPIRFYGYVDNETSFEKGQEWCPVSCHEPLTKPITTLNLATWNVWFDKLEDRSRFDGALQEILALPSLDIISFQEITREFLSWLQQSNEIRASWVLTNCWDEEHLQEISDKWYGCIFLVKKELAGNIRAWVKKFPTSKMGRFVVIAEVFEGKASLVISP